MMPLTPQERRALLFLMTAAVVGGLVIGYRRAGGAHQAPPAPAEMARWDAAAERLAPSGPVALNRATVAELVELPGIGPSLAARIVADRQARGPFLRVEDLQRIRGIGPKLVERLRGYVTMDR